MRKGWRNSAKCSSTSRACNAQRRRPRVNKESARGTAAVAPFTRRSASLGESRAPVFKVRVRGSAAAEDILASTRRGGALGEGRPVARVAGMEVTDPAAPPVQPGVGQLRGTEITSKSRTSH